METKETTATRSMRVEKLVLQKEESLCSEKESQPKKETDFTIRALKIFTQTEKFPSLQGDQ